MIPHHDSHASHLDIEPSTALLDYIEHHGGLADEIDTHGLAQIADFLLLDTFPVRTELDLTVPIQRRALRTNFNMFIIIGQPYQALFKTLSQKRMVVGRFGIFNARRQPVFEQRIEEMDVRIAHTIEGAVHAASVHDTEPKAATL